MGRPVPDFDDAAIDPAHMVEEMRALTQRAVETPVGVRAVVVERLERRLLRYQVEFQGAHSCWPVIGKVYESRAEGERAFDNMRRLWDGGFSAEPPASVRIPQPYGYLADLRLVLMEEVPGEPLKALVKRKRARPEDLRLFGVGLAKLHRSELIPGAPFRVDDHLAVRCDGRHVALAQAFPEMSARVRWIVERARHLEGREEALLTVAHGDFHLGQVHVLRDTLWILDLDPLHVGDPAYDVAMAFVMLKHLEEKVQDAAYLRSLRDAFIDAYFSPEHYEVARRVPLHIALIHLKRACKRFRYQDERGWPDTVRREIEEGATCMERMNGARVLRSTSDIADLYDRCPATV